MTKVLLDNDVILKTCRWLLGSCVYTVTSRHGTPAILGSARFVAARRLHHNSGSHHADAAREELRLFVEAAVVVEPNDAAIMLAADLQEVAQQLNLPLDGGESQLLAILVTTGSGMLITGDKRAIAAAASVATSVGKCEPATGRVACLEQLLSSMVLEIGVEAVRARVCSDCQADTAAATCFSCWTETLREDEVAAGLASYIASIRSRAGSFLIPGNDLSAAIT